MIIVANYLHNWNFDQIMMQLKKFLILLWQKKTNYSMLFQYQIIISNKNN